VTEPAGDRLSEGELQERASAGVAIVASRGLFLLIVGFGGNVVLARLLMPRDFGLVAFGLTIIALAQAVSDGGLGAGLIRRTEPPTRDELRAMLGLQFGATTILAGTISAIAASFGRGGEVVAIMVLTLPILTLGTPGRIVLERRLNYRPLAFVDVAQLVGYYLWAIPAVIAGLGVWALATASVFKAVLGAALLIRFGGLGFLLPSLQIGRVRPLLSFGVSYQAANLVWAVRDQILNLSIAAIAGVGTLGLWTLARRLLEVPNLLFDSLWRVSFPAMAQLRDLDRDPRRLIERAAGLATVGSGLVLTVLAASAPGLVPGLFGAQWSKAATALPFACLALLLSGPISVASVGYLYAEGRATTVLRATTAMAVAWVVVALPLLPVLGVAAVGVGWLAGALADAVIVGRATSRLSGANIVRPVALPAAMGVIAGAMGWVVAAHGTPTLLSGIAGGAVAALAFCGGVGLFAPQLLAETARFALRAVRSASGRRASSARSIKEPIAAA
jgi:O-antigen/teichoic acid export membrane protein